MKKSVALVLAVSMVFTSTVSAEGLLNKVSGAVNNSQTIQTVKAMGAALIQNTLAKFKDVKSGEWYMDSVSKLVELGGIKGYEDGTFRPTGTITRAEYTSIVAGSLGLKPVEGATGHWSAGIMAAATQAGLVQAGEFADVTKPITRFEMARMAVRAVTYQKEAVPADWADYTSLLSDLRNAPTVDRESASMVVAMGIISGYPDKTFQGTRTLSRAEASAVVIRILDKDARKVPAKPSATGTIQLGETKPLAEILPNDYTHPRFTVFGYKAIALVDAAPYTPKTFTTGDNKTGIMFKGRCGNLIVIKDNKVLGTEAELYDPKQGYTLYSNASWETADFFGFSTAEDTTLRMIANPWKK